MGGPSAPIVETPRMATYAVDQREPEDPDQRLSLLIVEDHPIYAEGLTMTLESRGPYNVVGVAGNSNAALTLARQLNPQMILLDVELPGESGLSLISSLSRMCSEAKIVILTGHGENEVALQAVRLGAHGYLQKDISSLKLLELLARITSGEKVIGKPETMTAIVDECGKLMRDREREKLGVTDVEVEIIRQAAQGMNNKEIGKQQFWSEITVKRKMQDAYRKLGVKTRAQAVHEAMRLGFI